jgi:hypothetical protein
MKSSEGPARLEAEGKDRREDGNPCQHRNQQVGQHHFGRGCGDVLIITEILP